MVKSQAQTPVLNTMQRTTDAMITPKVEAAKKLQRSCKEAAKKLQRSCKEAAKKIIPNTTNRQNPYNLKNSFMILTS